MTSETKVDSPIPGNAVKAVTRTVMPTYVEMLRGLENWQVLYTKEMEQDIGIALGGVFAYPDINSKTELNLHAQLQYAMESSLVKWLLKYTGGNKTRVARLAGLNRHTVDQMIRRCQIRVEDYK